MPLTGNFNILEKIRESSSGTLSSFLISTDSALREIYTGIAATAVEIEPGRVITVLNSSGMDAGTLKDLLNFRGKRGYRQRIIEGAQENGRIPANPEVIRLPLLAGNKRFGTYFIIADRSTGQAISGSSGEELAEILSLGLKTATPGMNIPDYGSECETLRAELLEGVENSEVMQAALIRILDLTGAEFCAFYTDRKNGKIDIMLDSRELVTLVPEISRKTASSFNHFMNNPHCRNEYREKVYYRSSRRNIRYLIGGVSIESHFLVPVVSGAGIMGIVFAGSVRRNSFTREQISHLKGLAGEGASQVQVVYRQSGEKETVDKIVESLPFGAALISRDGSIVSENSKFGEYLGSGGCRFQTLEDVSAGTGYNFSDYHSQINLVGRDINGRVLKPSGRSGKPLRVFWKIMENTVARADSILMITSGEDWGISSYREEIAMVAHEIRTPLSALRNSLAILSDEGLFGDTEQMNNSGKVTPGDIFRTALRTTERLNSILDSLDIESRAGMAGSGLNIRKCAPGEFINSVMVLYRKQMKQRGIRLTVDTSDQVGIIRTDTDRLAQIFQNLLSNSLKSGCDEVGISVSSTGVPDDSLLSGIPWSRICRPNLIEISVSDNGKGFPADVRDYVNDLSERELNPNFGLGLFISSRLARSLGGVLKAENRMDGGAKSRLYLAGDSGTRETVRTMHEIADRLNSMKALGKLPILYMIGKESGGCWLELAAGWRKSPLVNPPAQAERESDFYFWPLSSRIGIGLARGGRFLSEPEGIFVNGRSDLALVSDSGGEKIEIGWSICDDRDCGIRQMLGEAMEKLITGAKITL